MCRHHRMKRIPARRSRDDKSTSSSSAAWVCVSTPGTGYPPTPVSSPAVRGLDTPESQLPRCWWGGSSWAPSSVPTSTGGRTVPNGSISRRRRVPQLLSRHRQDRACLHILLLLPYVPESPAVGRIRSAAAFWWAAGTTPSLPCPLRSGMGSARSAFRSRISASI